MQITRIPAVEVRQTLGIPSILHSQIFTFRSYNQDLIKSKLACTMKMAPHYQPLIAVTSVYVTSHEALTQELARFLSLPVRTIRNFQMLKISMER